MHKLRSFVSFAIGLSVVSAYPNAISRRQDVSTQTTFQKWSGCTAAQKSAVQQANKDALDLAGATLYHQHDLDDSYVWVNFYGQAAHDYFGPQSQNAPFQEYIVNTLVRASTSERGLGWSDWWYDRYVDVHCDDPQDDCLGDSPAYTFSVTDLEYPQIAYCPSFFDKLESHSAMVQKIQADTTGELKQNTRNLRSQAVTALHEWLHIKGFSSEACVGGCKDTKQDLAGEVVRTYKSGRSKLLAKREASLAYRTNDNYVYFAVASWMEKKFGTYPQYPRAWDKSKTREQNQQAEDQEPGSPGAVQSWELEDDGATSQDEAAEIEVVDNDAYPESDYPDWYQPTLSGEDVSAPESEALPDLDWAAPSSDVTCETTDGSPVVDDCAHAFGTLYQFPDYEVSKGKKGGTTWAGYVQSCAIAVYYTDDWDDSCEATNGDVAAHASNLFIGCENGRTVGGNVEFNMPNCPAHIEIIKTDGNGPPSGEAP